MWCHGQWATSARVHNPRATVAHDGLSGVEVVGLPLFCHGPSATRLYFRVQHALKNAQVVARHVFLRLGGARLRAVRSVIQDAVWDTARGVVRKGRVLAALPLRVSPWHGCSVIICYYTGKYTR